VGSTGAAATANVGAATRGGGKVGAAMTGRGSTNVAGDKEPPSKWEENRTGDDTRALLVGGEEGATWEEDGNITADTGCRARLPSTAPEAAS
jgi:hypothetical protein